MIELANNEHVMLEKRKHWFIIAAELFAYTIIFLIPFIAYSLLSGAEVAIGQEAVPLTLEFSTALYLSSLWALVIWMRMGGIWTDYYLDVWTITNKRIVDIEQKGLFHRQTSVLKMSRIQDVTIETHGFIATLLNFGDIHVQTAGETREFVMHGIANPKDVRHVILMQLDRTEEQTEGKTSSGSV